MNSSSINRAYCCTGLTYYSLGKLYYQQLLSLTLSPAPPSIVCDPEFCTCYESSKTCRQPLITRVWDEDIQLTTNFSGQGPLSVVWEHRGRVLNCSTESSDDIKCTITRRKTSTYEYEVRHPFKINCCVGYARHIQLVGELCHTNKAPWVCAGLHSMHPLCSYVQNWIASIPTLALVLCP